MNRYGDADRPTRKSYLQPFDTILLFMAFNAYFYFMENYSRGASGDSFRVAAKKCV